jgi:hypothetical protein
VFGEVPAALRCRQVWSYRCTGHQAALLHPMSGGSNQPTALRLRRELPIEEG